MRYGQINSAIFSTFLSLCGFFMAGLFGAVFGGTLGYLHALLSHDPAEMSALAMMGTLFGLITFLIILIRRLEKAEG